MMLDANIVAVGPASVWRVLSRAGTAAEVEREALEERDLALANRRSRTSIGISLRSFWNGPKNGIPGLSLGSSPTAAPNLSPRTSRSSFPFQV
jgi:hypothetical protein